jgi:2-methylcitrate dehydratase PrpD
MTPARADAAGIFVDHALSLEWHRLSSDAQQAARAFLFDTICVGIAGRNAVNADLVWQLAASWGGAGRCAVLGRPGAATSAPYAAFMNAFQIHAQEYDCVHEAAVAHPMATVVAALLAEVGRSGPYDGASFLAALVAGVDVVATLGVAVTTPLRFFRPATAGIFGSVAALARLRRLDRAVARDAFGHALAYASGTMQAHLEGKPNLALQVAGAARSAVEAIDLATIGIAAPACAIDGPFGYLALFEEGADSAPASALLGKVERITELSWKPFPTGRAAQGAIVALRTMIDQGLTPETLERFTYRAPPLITRLVGRRPLPGMDAPYARLCFPYLGAITLLRGTVGLGDFAASSLSDPAVHALAERICVDDDGTQDPAAFVPAVATALRRDGSVLSVTVDAQFGSPAWPLDREQRFEKARACLAFGGLPGSSDALGMIHDAFETVSDVRAALAPAFG